MNRYELAVPDLGSLILTHDPNGVVRGLKDWPADERPSPEIVPFFGFRIMVGLALVMLAVVVASLWLRARGELFESRWFLWLCTLAWPLGFVAVLAAGRRLKSAGSRGRSTVSCARPIRCRRR